MYILYIYIYRYLALNWHLSAQQVGFYIYVYICLDVHIICIYICIYIHMYIHVCMCVCMYVCIHVCMYLYRVNPYVLFMYVCVFQTCFHALHVGLSERSPPQSECAGEHG